MNGTELILLYDYYGALLTQRQQLCFEMRYHQDLSLGEIGEELGISRQGVHDNLSRTEALLRKMEEKTDCVRRDISCRKASKVILQNARILARHEDANVSALASDIVTAAEALGD